jgi:hypothetical protein
MDSDRNTCCSTKVQHQCQSCTLHVELRATGYIGP